MEWLENIWQWVLNNYAGVMAFLSSANIAGVISNIAFIFKQSKATANNTLAAQTLNSSITMFNDMKSVLEETNKINQTLLSELKTLHNENEVLKESLVASDKKLDSLIDALIIVYSTIKDDNIRHQVENILNAAKYSDLSKVTKEIDDKIIGAVTNVTSKIAEDLSAKFVTKKELTDTNKTIKKNKVSTTRY